MVKRSNWAKMPLRWIHQAGLAEFKGRSLQPVRLFSVLEINQDADDMALRNESLSALKLYLVLCCQADYTTGIAKVTYPKLCELAIMSRALVAKSLTRLEQAKLIRREAQALKNGSSIQIENWNDDYGWGKIPKLWLYDGNSGRMLHLKEFNFTQLSFYSLKIFIGLLAYRDKRGIATLSYDRLSSITGVPRHHIADSITRLYDMRLISFRPGDFNSPNEFDRTNRYLVRGFNTRWPALEEAGAVEGPTSPKKMNHPSETKSPPH